MAVAFWPERLIDAVGGTGAAVAYPLAAVPGRVAHLLRIQTANYTGVVDIQGRMRAQTTWANIPYVTRAEATAVFGAPTVAQLSYSGSTAVAYVLVAEPREFLRLLVDPGGGNAGTITVDVLGVEDDAALAGIGGGTLTIAGTISGNVSVVGNVAANAADSGNPVKVGGKYNSSAPTLDNGDRGDLELDVNGRLIDTLGTLIAGENLTLNRLMVLPRFTSSAKITADAQVKAGSGFLHTITLTPNDAAATAGSVIVYDSLSETGTEIVNITFIAAWFAPITLIIDVDFATGLYVGFTTTTDINVEISYL